MGIVISKMVSVKRQIENVRNLARSEAMGAFAPLVEGLAPVTEAISLGKQAIREASSLRRTALASLPVASVDLTPLPSTPFNGVMKRCAAPAPDGGGDPVPSSSLRTPAVPAAAQASGASSFSSFRAGSPGDYPGFGFRPILRQADPNSQQQTPPPNNNQNNQQSTDPPGESATVPEALEFHELCMPDPAVAYDTQAAADLEEVAEDAIDAYFGEDADYDATAPAAMGEALEASLEEFQMHAERSEDEIAQAQALIDGMMAVYEEFYGCLAVPDDGEMLDDPETPYCLSNLGKGMGDRKEGDGTASLLDDILAKLDTIGRQPDGNASQTQLSTLQTQLQVYIARATAMRTQARAWELEMQNEKKLMAEAQQRRIYEAFNRDPRLQRRPWRHFAVRSRPRLGHDHRGDPRRRRPRPLHRAQRAFHRAGLSGVLRFRVRGHRTSAARRPRFRSPRSVFSSPGRARARVGVAAAPRPLRGGADRRTRRKVVRWGRPGRPPQVVGPGLRCIPRFRFRGPGRLPPAPAPSSPDRFGAAPVRVFRFPEVISGTRP